MSIQFRVEMTCHKIKQLHRRQEITYDSKRHYGNLSQCIQFTHLRVIDGTLQTITGILC